jgi:para-aminobenzoate synthetase component 1
LLTELLAELSETLIATELPYLKECAITDYFKPFADTPWSFCLDSCRNSNFPHIDANTDIMVWQPIITLTATNRQTCITRCDTQQQLIANDNPLSLLKQVQQIVNQHVAYPQIPSPFKSGAVGYFSYDLARYLEKIPTMAINDIQLPEMAVGLYFHTLILDHQRQRCWLICPADEQQQWVSFFKARVERVGSERQHQQLGFQLTQPWQSNMSAIEYEQKFHQVQQFLLDGDCYQINLTQRFQASYQGDEFCAYLALKQANDAPFSAFMRLTDHTIMSVSPERFLQVLDQQVQTKPIKGTLPRSTDIVEDQQRQQQLATSAKDRAENLMIVDLLRNDISRVCQAGSVKVPQLFAVESFPAVHHLVSTITGTLKPDASAHDLLAAAFPGGSITGAPKIRAMEIIEQLEPQRRSIYCGSIGYISADGNMDTSITIRTLVAKNNTVYCWAGGGVVADSTAQSEYQESFDKVSKILPVLDSLTIAHE